MKSKKQNIYQHELENFNSLADSWWDPKGKLKTLHVINPLRLRFINNAIDLKSKQVLDVGCGGGLLCESMAKQAAIVTGIDISKKLIQVAVEHAATNNLKIDYQVCTIENFLSGTTRRFDVITCMEMLEHVPDPVSIINVMSQLLNPGGHLLLSTINRSLKSYINMIMGAEYILNIVPKNTHNYSQFIKPSELNAWLVHAGFELIEIAGIDYIPLVDYASLTSTPSVNFIIHAVLKD